MNRPSSFTIYVKKRAVQVERKAVRPRPTKRMSQFSTANELSEIIGQLPNDTILSEVERCLSHRPIAFPRKLWGEVI